MDILLWVGIAFLLAILAYLLREDVPLVMSRQLRARGTVYDHCRRVDDGSEFFMAMVRFRAADGRWIEFTDSLGLPKPKPPVGTQVDVVYPADAPEKARVKRLWLRWVIYAFLLFGLSVMIGRLMGWLR